MPGRLCLLVLRTVVAGAVFTVGLVADVDECNVDDIYHMLVVQGVEYVLSFAAAFYQAFVSEEAELVGNRRLGHIYCSGNVVDTKLVRAQGTEDFHPGFIADHLKESRCPAHKFRCDVLHGSHLLFVDSIKECGSACGNQVAGFLIVEFGFHVEHALSCADKTSHSNQCVADHS